MRSAIRNVRVRQMKRFLKHDLLIAPVKCVLADRKAYFSPAGLFVHDLEEHVPNAHPLSA